MNIINSIEYLTTTDLGIELLQVSFGMRAALTCVPSDKEWNNIYRFAKEQSILGVLFGGVEQLPVEQRPNRDLLMDWFGKVVCLKIQNELLDKTCMDVCKMFHENGFNSCILKGQGNNRMYQSGGSKIPSALIRTPGDIDIWVWPQIGSNQKMQGKMGRVSYMVDSMPSLDERRVMIYNFCRDTIKGYDARKEGKLHTSFSLDDGIIVEVHCTPSMMNSKTHDKKLQLWFESYINTSLQKRSQDFENFPTPTLEFNLVYQIHHMYRHYLFEGIGLKQVIDYYMLLKNLDALDARVRNLVTKQVVRTFEELGIDKFASAMMWVLSDCLGVNRNIILCKPNAKLGKHLWRTILEGGNFGHNWGSIAHDDWRHPIRRIKRYVKRNGQLLFLYPEEVIWHAARRLKESVIGKAYIHIDDACGNQFD